MTRHYDMTLNFVIDPTRIFEQVYALAALHSFNQGRYGDKLRRTVGTDQQPALRQALKGSIVNLAASLSPYVTKLENLDGDLTTIVISLPEGLSLDAPSQVVMRTMIEESLAYGVLELMLPMKGDTALWGQRAVELVKSVRGFIEPPRGLSLSACWA